MQGRLSPAQNGRLQFFPLDWLAEFAIAAKIGFSHIQWFLDRDIPGFDPIKDLWSQPEVLRQIDAVRKLTPISSVDCGTYALFGREAVLTLHDFPLLFPSLAGRLATNIVSLALLEKNAPKTEGEKQEVLVNLKSLADLAATYHLRLALETELPAFELVAFLERLGRSNVGIGYDLGNCTSYGFDCPADIKFLGEKIIEVHCKDRRRGSSQSLLLGTGDTNYPDAFAALKEIGYSGAITLQAWRGEDYLADAETQLKFVKGLL